MHKLKILTEDSLIDAKTLSVFDISSYDALLTLTGRRLCIKAPGMPPVTVPWPEDEKRFDITSETIGLTAATEPLSDLPDGAWVITYSVSPNNEVFTEQWHGRTAHLMLRLIAEVVKTGQSFEGLLDDRGNIELDKRNKVLFHTWGLVMGVKAAAGSHRNLTLLDKLYQQAVNQLDGISKYLTKKNYGLWGL